LYKDVQGVPVLYFTMIHLVLAGTYDVVR
jgi:hypothetical protein